MNGSLYSKDSLIKLANLVIKGTLTEFPACLYKCEFAISDGNLKFLGNP